MNILYKVFLRVVLLLMPTLIMASCNLSSREENVPLYTVIPWGVWVSEQSHMTLYILPEYDLSSPYNDSHFVFPGTYKVDGAEIEIHADFRPRRGMIGGFREYELYIFRAFVDSGSRTLYSGVHERRRDGFWIEYDQLHYMFRRDGYGGIMIFNRR